MALVTPLSENHDKEVQELADFFNETLGFCPNSVLTMQIRPAIAKAFIHLNKAVMDNQESLTAELKRLVGYLTSHVTGCQYCKAHTILAAKRYGASEQRLKNIWNYKNSSLYTEREKAAFDFAIAASTIPNGVDQHIEQNLKKHFTEGEVVELLGVISLFGFLNRWNDSMATTLEQGAIQAGSKYLHENHWAVEKHK